MNVLFDIIKNKDTDKLLSEEKYLQKTLVIFSVSY